ncbi:MAG: bifunctional riboflavin kinase/FAD synthetase [Alphaproteobacteria bacterium]|nr:bifunctional riboflavin kinase/FAD synthetase [Alphaproteobacteria bacterium]
MRLYRHSADLPDDAKGAVVAIGNFDGVHRGHQAVIGAACGLAMADETPLGVLTFEPHPREVFGTHSNPFRLTPLRIKARLIEALDVDFLFVQHFDRDFAQLTPQEFVLKTLVDGLKARHVVVGYDFEFGKNREGNVALLQKLGGQFGFAVTSVQPVSGESGLYSSTAVRAALSEGRPGDAAALLGHWWEIEGRIEHGQAKGSGMGFPTANLKPQGVLAPATGAYAVRAGIDMGDATRWVNGVANFGKRPTVTDKDEQVFEVHLFDCKQDLYGKHLRVRLIGHLRPERRFDSLEALKAQIAQDVAQARNILEQTPDVPPKHAPSPSLKSST